MTRKPTVAELRKLLKKYDKGLLYAGSHSIGSKKMCAIEFVNIIKVKSERLNYCSELKAFEEGKFEHFSYMLEDDPGICDLPDFRNLNDLFTNNEERTKHMLPVLVAYWNWNKFKPATRQKVVDTLLALLGDRVEHFRKRYLTSEPPLDNVDEILEQFVGVSKNNKYRPWRVTPPEMCKLLIKAMRAVGPKRIK